MSIETIDLARDVLESAKYAESRFMSISDMPSIGRAAPTLAHAVIDLAAERDAYVEENMRLREQVARVRALADRPDAEAGRIGTSGGGATVRAFAAEIRTALNGETND